MTEHVKVALDLGTGEHDIIGHGATWTEANGFAVPEKWTGAAHHVVFTCLRAELQAVVTATFELGCYEDDAHLELGEAA